MKQVKRIASLLLAVVMVVTMSMSTGVTVFAAGGHTVTVTNAANATGEHTYEAYQIFAGKYDDTSKTLTDITWGTGVKDSGTVSFNGADYDLAKAADAAKLAKALGDANLGFDAKEVQDFAASIGKCLSKTVAGSAKATGANAKAEITGLSDGYYFIKDADASQDGKNDAYTRYILQVSDDVNVTAKSDVPTVTKKVQDNETADTADEWQDSADYAIGEDVPFKLTGTVSAKYADFKTYKYVFHDTLSAGLTFNNDVEVYVDGSDTAVDKSLYTVKEESGKLTIAFDNLKDVKAVKAGSAIEVRYTAALNANAAVGNAGNPNEVYLEFSNNPNGSATGKTPEDKVTVFTYKIVINKTDENNAPLEGAKFALYKKDASGAYSALVGEKEAEAVRDENDKITACTLSFEGLDAGEYMIKETQTPESYNTLEDQYFTVEPTHEIDADNPQLTDLNGNVTDGQITFSKDVPNASLSTTIVNQKGTILPGTGGIGTTIFYIVGGVLVIGAAVLLVLKRRVRR